LNLAFCFALVLGLGVITQGRAEDYYIYQAPNVELVISNKEPPPGGKIIKQQPGVTDKEVPEAKAPGKTPPSAQGSPKPNKNKEGEWNLSLYFEP
jgi:hypothetical protein